MEGAERELKKFIIGWLTLRPGKRDEFMGLALPYIAATRQEQGCVFFEMNPSAGDPDIIVVAECFRDVEAHTAHLKTQSFLAFWRQLDRLCLHGRFENIFADRVVADSATFGGPTPAAVQY